MTTNRTLAPLPPMPPHTPRRAFDADSGRELTPEEAETAAANPGIYRWVTFA